MPIARYSLKDRLIILAKSFYYSYLFSELFPFVFPQI